MPVISSTYQSPPFFGSAHLQTVYPTLWRKIPPSSFRRERIVTPDDDFLDLDWSVAGHSRIAILSHGLEGNSQRIYMQGMARALNLAGIGAIGWNYRGCSGEINRKLHFYHSGFTTDLQTVIEHVQGSGDFQEIWLIGFSIGGNITLKLMGEKSDELSTAVKGAIVFSVPCHLASSSLELAKPHNVIYMRRFLRQLREKIRLKMAIMPGQIDDNDYHLIRNFLDFDNRYTAPLNGFRDAHDYWEKSSSIYFLDNIRRPTLIVNAKNDTFLSERCYPVCEARRNPFIQLEMPAKGGHVGFVQFNMQQTYWLEDRAIAFISQFSEPTAEVNQTL